MKAYTKLKEIKEVLIGRIMIEYDSWSDENTTVHIEEVKRHKSRFYEIIQGAKKIMIKQMDLYELIQKGKITRKTSIDNCVVKTIWTLE